MASTIATAVAVAVAVAVAEAVTIAATQAWTRFRAALSCTPRSHRLPLVSHASRGGAVVVVMTVPSAARGVSTTPGPSTPVPVPVPVPVPGRRAGG